MTTREFSVLLSGLSGDALYRAWLDKQPRESAGEQETRSVLARL